MNLSPDQQHALDVLLRSSAPAAVFGGAGTGKSTILRALLKEFELEGSRYVVCAPTGVAALNVQGATLHSVFGLPVKPGPLFLKTGSRRPRFERYTGESFLPELTIIIDEISMVRPDVLDAIDMSLREHPDDRPFGGARVVLFGDPLQLPPIVQRDDRLLVAHLDREYNGVPWFFASRAFRELNPFPLLLEVSHRQQGRRFYEALSALRYGDARYLDYLNSAARQALPGDPPRGVMIGTHRKQVQKVNERCLAQIPADSRIFRAELSGKRPEALPVDEALELKVGAHVVCAANQYRATYDETLIEDDTGQNILAANGSQGVVIELEPLKVRFETGITFPLNLQTWDFFGYDAGSGKIEKTGYMKQMPLLLGWAITSHKSQGMSLSAIEVDIRKMFDTGQSYVALSRVFGVEGLTLRHYLMPQHFTANPYAVQFMHSFTKAAYWARERGWSS